MTPREKEARGLLERMVVFAQETDEWTDPRNLDQFALLKEVEIFLASNPTEEPTGARLLECIQDIAGNVSEEDLIERLCEVQGFLRNGIEEPTQGEWNQAIEAAANVLDSYAEEMADEAVAQFANLASADVRALSRPPSEAPIHDALKGGTP